MYIYYYFYHYSEKLTVVNPIIVIDYISGKKISLPGKEYGDTFGKTLFYF